MSPLVQFLIVVVLLAFLAGFVVGLSSCMLSAQITRRQEEAQYDELPSQGD